MPYLKDFPIRLESWLDVWDVESDEDCYSEWKYFAHNLPTPIWVKKFCIILENEQRFYIFDSKSDSSSLISPPHIGISTIDDTVCYALQALAKIALSDDNFNSNNNCYSYDVNNVNTRGNIVKCNNKNYCKNNLPQHCLINRSTNESNTTLKYKSLYVNNGVINFENKNQMKIQQLLFRMKNYFFRPTSRSPTRNSSSNQRNFTNKKDQIYRNFVDLCTESPKVRTFSSSPSISMKYVNLLNGKFISSDNIGISDVQYWKFIRKRLRKSRRQSLKSVLHNPPHCLYRDNYLGTFQRSISFQQIKCKNKDPTSTFISSNSLLGSSTSLNSFANFEFSKDKPRQSTVSMMQTQLQCSHHISSDNIYCQHTKNNKKDGLLETVEHIVDYIPIKERSFQNFTEPVCNKHCDSINGTFKQTMNKCVCSTKRSPIFSSSSSLQYTGFKNNNNGCNHCSAFIYSLVQAGTVHVSTIHQSLTGGRPFCFVFTGPIVQMSSVEKKECLKDTTLFTRIFAAESWESRAKWMKR